MYVYRGIVALFGWQFRHLSHSRTRPPIEAKLGGSLPVTQMDILAPSRLTRVPLEAIFPATAQKKLHGNVHLNCNYGHFSRTLVAL